MIKQRNIRNFSIIAHVDHGKSSLADRMIEVTGSLQKREMKEQLLDSLDVERERGITVKAQSISLAYSSKLDKQEYILNLMDTPGHVDFNYEVSRCLSACEGALLLVDATQGVEAQTLANAYLAIDKGLKIITVINKIDLFASDVERVLSEVREVIGIDTDDVVLCSAKTGQGVVEILEEIVKKIPPPSGIVDAPLKALLIDSRVDTYRGIVIQTRIFDGSLKVGDKIKFWSNSIEHEVEQLGIYTPKDRKLDSLSSGAVGYIIAGIRDISSTTIGDTITHLKNPCLESLPDFKPVRSVVFCCFFPASSEDFNQLKTACEQLALNDSGFSFQVERSNALGFGLRCGFLGILHLEIVAQRLLGEYKQEIITTAPSVVYNVLTKNGQEIEVHSANEFPDRTKVEIVTEPWILATVILPSEYLGAILALMLEKRGKQKSMKYFEGNRVVLEFELPLAEVVFDFHDRIKSHSKGYASFDYHFLEMRDADIQVLDILINGDKVGSFSSLVHSSFVVERGKKLCSKLKELIPRQMYQVAIQAVIGGKIIARETISALRKDVTAKCYGGDVSRKRKLLEKQKAGKKKMKKFGKIDIPKSAFLQAIKDSS